MKKIILASSSPRRQELLKKHHYDFIVDFQEIDEVLDLNLALPLRLEKLAYQKAQVIASKYPHDLIIGADTMVCLNDKMLGKPKNRTEAKEMLQFLSNQTQTVYTAVAIIDDGKIIVFHDATKVTFKSLSTKQIESYLNLNEWQGKAGAYAIQGYGKDLVLKIDGDIETVIGLPVKLINDYLQKNW
ncbi:nucleoside triphosphate pyrophosphatase [uncultured Thomasclavelia sp.]|uniref:Maf family protein n=1 Tax=uncultured Thomasclavelia sp. TaxID=3025759 RepID=UPI0025F037F0|nr:Maf family protein [uncultured Thomasclavelia sp.]